jgi:hypothetical protein
MKTSGMVPVAFSPSCHHIWRQYTEYALVILQDDAVEIDEVPDAVGTQRRHSGRTQLGGTSITGAADKMASNFKVRRKG